MFDFRVLTDWNYYFNARPTDGLTGFTIPLLALFLLMLVAAVYFKVIFSIYRKKLPYYRQLGDKLFNWLLTTAIFGLMYVFFRYEGIMYLSARIVLFAIVIMFLIWGYKVYTFYISDFATQRESFKSEKKIDKYFPKKKKRK